MQSQHHPQDGDDAAVTAALASMRLSADDLRSALLAADHRASECTENDVRTLAGTLRWATPLRHLGDAYASRGFSRVSRGGFEMLVGPNERWALSVAPGDSATGTERMPTTRVSRGPLTGQAVDRNLQQLSFFGKNESNEVGSIPGFKVWLLLHFVDPLANEIRSELSLPVEFRSTADGKKGHVTRFEPRLILPPIARDELASPEREDDDDDDLLDIPIARR